jgi:hypothetical protein
MYAEHASQSSPMLKLTVPCLQTTVRISIANSNAALQLLSLLLTAYAHFWSFYIYAIGLIKAIPYSIYVDTIFVYFDLKVPYMYVLGANSSYPFFSVTQAP